jgi:hypothetical protein
VPLDPPDAAGSVHVTGLESSVKAIRGAESRAAGLQSVDLLEPVSPSAATKTHSVACQSGTVFLKLSAIADHFISEGSTRGPPTFVIFRTPKSACK